MLLHIVKYVRNEDAIKMFGENVRRIRMSKNISQEQLAYKAEVEFSQISRIERGKVNTSVSMIYILATALEIDPKELI